MGQNPMGSRLRGMLLRNLAGRALLAVAFLALVLIAQPSTAAADFRLCNNTGNRVGLAVGYKETESWTTEGWWNLAPRSCETVLRGSLVARFYYIYAVDYDRGGEWSGQAFMCTRDKEFTIKGAEDCLARGFDRTGFFEVDTGEQPNWTVQLTESGDQAPQQPLQTRIPLPSLGTPPSTIRPGITPPAPRSRN
jgi:uncharacterized membrane protein